jgi:hypothetical protein
MRWPRFPRLMRFSSRLPLSVVTFWMLLVLGLSWPEAF